MGYYGHFNPSDPVDDARYAEHSLYRNLISQLDAGSGVDGEDIAAWQRARETVRTVSAVWSEWDGALGSHLCWEACE